MDSPTSVPPGSRATITGRFCDLRKLSSNLICVVLPDPSMPSKEIKAAMLGSMIARLKRESEFELHFENGFQLL